MPHAVRLIFIALCVAVALSAGGCAAGPTWVDSGTQYTLEQARTLMGTVDTARFAKSPASDAARLRLEALGSLRGKSAASAQAADLIVKTFPADTIGVPVYVELARIDERKVLAIVEAWGVTGGSLEHERLWIIDAATGEIIDSTAGS